MRGGDEKKKISPPLEKKQYSVHSINSITNKVIDKVYIILSKMSIISLRK